LCVLSLASLTLTCLAADPAPSAPSATTSAPDAAPNSIATPSAPSSTNDTVKDVSTQKADGVAAVKGLAALEFRADKPIDFGKTTLGFVSPALTVTLVASPAASVAESYTVRATGDFKATPATCEVAAKGACAVSVTFAPTKPGTTTGAVVVGDAQGGPMRVAAELQGWGEASLGPVILICSLFLLGMLFVRWNMVAMPAREQLTAEIDTVRTRISPDPAAADLGGGQGLAVARLLEFAAIRLNPGKRYWQRIMNMVFWSRGQEHMGFQLLHEAKRLLVAGSPPDILRVELEVAEGRLRARNEPGALALANSIRAELDKALVDVNDQASAVLRETLAYLKRTAGDAISSVAAATAPDSATTVADMAALAKRLQAAFNQGQQSALDLAVDAALQAPPEGLPAEYRSLLGHTRDVLLKRAEQARAALEKATAPPTLLDAAQWREALNDFSQLYLAEAELLRVRIEAALGATVVQPPGRWRALAGEANHHLYDVEDAEFAWTASWHKKTLWLVFLGLMLICALSATYYNTTLFLLGALGGLLSRLQRMLTRDTVPVDYGQSWVTLFLSPVVGALAGWGGVLLVAVAVDWGLLGELFRKVQWDQPHHVLTMGIALLFGISERLLVSVVGGLEGKVNAGPQDVQTPAAGKAAVPASGNEAKPKVGERSAAAAPASKGLEVTTPSTLPKCKAGSEFSQKFRADGGAAPLVWTLARGPLPEGLTLDDKGELKGKPLQVQNATFTLAVHDSAGAHHEREFSLQVTE
jgi:hypothetical protein